MEITQFSLQNIQYIEDHGLFMGKFQISIDNPDGESANVTTLTPRISLAKTSTFEEIERQLFAAARDHLSQVAQLFAAETPESLRLAVRDRQSTVQPL